MAEFEYGIYTNAIWMESPKVPFTFGHLTPPKIVVIHSTETDSIEHTIDRARLPSENFGTHFTVDRNGDIYQFVRTYHRPLKVCRDFHLPDAPILISEPGRSHLDSTMFVSLQMHKPRLSRRKYGTGHRVTYDRPTKVQWLSLVGLMNDVFRYWGDGCRQEWVDRGWESRKHDGIYRIDSMDGVDRALDRRYFPGALRNPGPNVPIHLLQKRLCPRERPRQDWARNNGKGQKGKPKPPKRKNPWFDI